MLAPNFAPVRQDRTAVTQWGRDLPRIGHQGLFLRPVVQCFLLVFACRPSEMFLKSQVPFKVILLIKRPRSAQSHPTLGLPLFWWTTMAQWVPEKFAKVTISYIPQPGHRVRTWHSPTASAQPCISECHTEHTPISQKPSDPEAPSPLGMNHSNTAEAGPRDPGDHEPRILY